MYTGFMDYNRGGRARREEHHMPRGPGLPRNFNRNFQPPYWYRGEVNIPEVPHFEYGREQQPNRHIPQMPRFENAGGWPPDHHLYDFQRHMPQPPPFRNFHDPQVDWHPQADALSTMNGGSDGPYGPNMSSHPPTNQERYRLFETMLRCGVKMHSKTYLAIYWLKFNDLDTHLTSPLFENDPDKHAEEHLMEHLLLQLDVIHKDRLMSITIMQNASPCSECAARYKENLQERLGRDSDVQVFIVFSAFHWLRRLSCRHEDHRHKFIPKEIHENNRDGLRQLCEAGFTVRTTCYEDWTKLCTALQVPVPVHLQCEESYSSSNCAGEDDRLRGDLEEILS